MEVCVSAADVWTIQGGTEPSELPSMIAPSSYSTRLIFTFHNNKQLQRIKQIIF